jgi:hypothetical protein
MQVVQSQPNLAIAASLSSRLKFNRGGSGASLVAVELEAVGAENLIVLEFASAANAEVCTIAIQQRELLRRARANRDICNTTYQLRPVYRNSGRQTLSQQ